jgi:cytochrome P450
MGLPEEDGDLYRKWINQFVEISITDSAALIQANNEVTHYFMRYVHERMEKPGDDLISYLINVEFNGEAISVDNVLGSLRLLLIAGIDTTWSAIGSCIWHLATHPGRSPAVGEEALAHGDSDRGVPARLCTRDHGARGRERDRAQRLHVQARSDGVALLSGRLP